MCLPDEKQFTPEELALISGVWSKEPPAECVGKCKLVHTMFVSGCSGCGWDDWGCGGD
jgi:hypothetical protein